VARLVQDLRPGLIVHMSTNKVYGDRPNTIALRELPRSGEVYNLGGGKANSCSILEAFRLAESFTGRRQVFTMVEQNRTGPHRDHDRQLRRRLR
jgi:hypothetical protein